MDAIHKNIIDNFTNSFEGFEDSQKKLIELIKTMPEKQSFMFNEFLLKLNVAVAKQDKPALIELLADVSKLVDTQK